MDGRLEKLILGFFLIIFLFYAAQAVLIGDIFRLFAVLTPSIILSLLPIVFEYRMKLNLPAGTKALVALALLLHVAGGINRFYWKFAPYYDKIAHVVSSIALVLLIFCSFAVLDHWGKRLSMRVVMGSTVLIAALFMITWEFAEFYIDAIVKSSYNTGIGDTAGDLIANVIGVGIGYMFIWFYLWRAPPGRSIGSLLTRNERRTN